MVKGTFRVTTSEQRNGPLGYLQESFLKSTMSSHELGILAMRWAALFLKEYAAAKPNSKLLDALSYAIAISEPSIAQDAWGCHYRGKHDPILNTHRVCDLGRKIGRKLTKEDEQAISIVAFSIWCGTRVSYHERSYDGVQQPTFSQASYKNLIATAFSSQHCLFWVASNITDFLNKRFKEEKIPYPSAKSKKSDIIINEERAAKALEPTISFKVEVAEFLSGKWKGKQAFDEYPRPSNGHDRSWFKTPGLRYLRLRLMGRAGWAELVARERKALVPEHPSINSSLARVLPLENHLDRHGMPIPGRKRKAGEGLSGDGVTRVRGIELVKGDIEIVGDRPRNDEIALVTPHDLWVICALVFGEKSPQHPVFSLNFIKDLKKGDATRSILQECEFEPGWIQATRLGQSIFYADYLLQQIIGQEDFPVQSLTNYRASRIEKSMREWTEKERAAATLLGSLRNNYNDNIEGKIGARYCISIRDVVVRGSKRKIDVVKGSCYIESSYIVKTKNGDINNRFRLDDQSTSIGRNAHAFTKNFDKICILYPVFRRVEQLLILHKLIFFAHKTGLRLPKSRQGELSAWIKDQKSHVVQQSVPMSYHNHGCTCCGDWCDAVPKLWQGEFEFQRYRSLGYGQKE